MEPRRFNPGANKSILIIEDDDSVRALMSLAMSEAGFDVTEATTGREALDVLKEKLPDVVLLDLGLPDVEGYIICKMLSDEDVMNKVPVIVVSGWTSLESRLRSFISGAKAFVSKPFLIEDIVEKALFFAKRNGMDDFRMTG